MLPLSGIKVIDMAQVLLGPSTAVYLADQGADVIKVEPLQGDSNRLRYASPYLLKHGIGKQFIPLNRNKRGIALEVHTPEGQEIVHRLARWADVFILNMRPGAEARVRLDYETLAALNPGLIYASISAFGRQGPDAGLPGYDIVIQSRSGILSTQPTRNGTPVPSIVMVADMSGCMGLAYAIMVALWERARTGKGQRVDTALLHSALAMQLQQMVWIEGDDSPLAGVQPNALLSCYECEDGKWITIVVLENHQWHGLCRAMELDHLANDPRFASYELRTQTAFELYQVLDAIFHSRPLAAWLEILQAAGVPCSPMVARDDVPADCQAEPNEMFWVQDHPAIGQVKMVAPPFQLSASRDEPRLRLPAPLLGQHTREVLHALGYDEDTVSAYYHRGVIK